MQPSLSMLPGFESDLHNLSSEEAKKLTLETISNLKRGILRGQPLDELSHTGDLSDCFKLYFDFPDYPDKPRYRLVYREQDDKYTMINLQMVAVGKRQDSDAYIRALKTSVAPSFSQLAPLL